MSVDLKNSRRTLPAPMLDRSCHSIFSVIKQAVGKDLTRFSIPVVWNEPLSFLQRLAESLEYSYLLDQAALTETQIDRFHLLTAFVVSTLSGHIERMSKPFNPLLGETYELQIDGENSFHYIAEQVSHHPPISALFVRGNNWTLSANVEPKVKFQGTNVVALSEGRWILRIRPLNKTRKYANPSEPIQTDDINEDEYTWSTPSVVVHNILFGRLWCEFQGSVDLRRTQSDWHSMLIIKSHSWFASHAEKVADLFKYTGFIFNGKEKMGAFHGNYAHCYYAVDQINDLQTKSTLRCSADGHNCIHLNSNNTVSTPCDFIRTPSSRLIWRRSLSSMTEQEILDRSQYYYFTRFTTCLNELTSILTLPCTDSRNRPDIRYLETGDTHGASIAKHQLEENQRNDARERSEDFQPLWFKQDRHGEFIYNGKYDERKFDRCPCLFSL